MLRPLLGLLAVLAIALPSAASSAGKKKLSVREMLMSRICRGQPCAILPSPTGLIGMQVDGSPRFTLAPGRVDWAYPDPRAGVVWFGAGGMVKAIDLEADTLPAPVTILEAPTAPDEESFTFGVAHPDGARIGPPDPLVTLRLSTSKPVAAFSVDVPEVSPVLHDSMSKRELASRERAFARWQRRLKVAKGASAFLLQAARRANYKPRSVVPGPRPAGDGQIRRAGVWKRVSAVPRTGCPDEPERCGIAEPFPGTVLWSVVVGYSCGDTGCDEVHQLYEPRTNRFYDIESNTLSKEGPIKNVAVPPDLIVALDGSAFIADGKIYWAVGRVISAGGGRGGGWLRGGYVVRLK